jgi:phosphatidylserine/phosphatidylglycerophosphate/cardiolipin synthase-like enzyme
VRDGERAFVGSQSLRSHELDLRREVGIIVHDPRIVQGIQRVFEQDWALTTSGRLAAVKSAKAEKAVKNVMAKVMNAN